VCNNKRWRVLLDVLILAGQLLTRVSRLLFDKRDAIDPTHPLVSCLCGHLAGWKYMFRNNVLVLKGRVEKNDVDNGETRESEKLTAHRKKRSKKQKRG
jgi:hypothetical protein